MKFKYFPAAIQGRYLFLVLFFLSISSIGLNAQNKAIRIKLYDNSKMLKILQNEKILPLASGYISTGDLLFDDVASKYKVSSIKRVFRPAGKFESRHIESGLHLWYEIELGEISTDQYNKSVSDFANLPDVQIAEPVYEKKLYDTEGNDNDKIQSKATTVNDPLFSDQWHYHNTGQTGGTPGADIDLQNAWDIQMGSDNVIVGVVDMGIQTDHPDLAGALWVNETEYSGTTGVDDDGNGYIDDIHGYNFADNTSYIPAGYHGTHVAGTIGAITNNSIGVSGVAGGSGSADGVRLMSCVVFGDFNSGGFEEAYVYSADMGAVISQNSWGYIYPGVYEQSVLDAIDYFIEHAGKDVGGTQIGPMSGGIVIFAAGNDNADGEYYPGYYEPVLSVAATTHTNTKANYSNYGAWVEVSAPGGETIFDTEDGVFSTYPGSSYDYLQGTSMACPHVSGVAALIVSEYGGDGFNPQFVWDRLVLSTVNIDDVNPSYIGLLGSGLINAYNALETIDEIPPAPITDLTVSEHSPISIGLTWTATGSSGTEGKATYYILRYSGAPINEGNFNSAQLVPNLPRPQVSGETETFVVQGLIPGTTYYFAIKAVDLGGLISGISNIVMTETDPAPVISITPEEIHEVADSGTTVYSTLHLENVGDADLEFTFPQFTGKQNALKQNNTSYIPFDIEPEKNKPDTRIGHPVLKGSGDDGTDGFGYSWIDSDEPGGPSYSWIDISSTGTEVELWDDSYITVNLPFDFQYYDNTYSSVHISSNGFITFNENGAPYCSNEQIPSEYFPNDMIAAFWDDLYPSGYNIFYQSSASSFIVMYQDIPHISYIGTYTFEIILYPNGEIKYQYKTITGSADNCTVGIENADGTEGLQIAFNTTYLKSNLAILISTHHNDFIKSVDPVSGTIPSGNSIDIQVELSADSISPDNYESALMISTNDPSNPEPQVPVYFHVNGTPRIGVTDNTLDFGTVFITDTLTQQVEIINTGTDSLRITGITGDNSVFFIKNFTETVIYKDETVAYDVYFAPLVEQNYLQEMIIHSNAANQSELPVQLTGEGVLPPVIAVSPDSFFVDVLTGDIVTETLTIDNSAGNSILEYSINIDYNNKDISSEITVAKGEKFFANSVNTNSSTPQFTKQESVGILDNSNILVLEEIFGGGYYYDDALENLGLSRTLVTDFSQFYTDLTNGTAWDLIIVNSYGNTVDEVILDSLCNFLDRGAKLIYAAWDVEYIYYHRIFTDYLGVDFISSITTPINFSATLLSHSIFMFPNSISELFWTDDQGIRDGQIADPISGSQSIAAFDGYPDNGCIILNSMQSTIFNAFQAENYNGDDDTDGKNDMLELIENEISNLLSFSGWIIPDTTQGSVEEGTSQDVEITFDATGLFGGDYYAVVEIESNDPVNSLVDVPAHMHVTGAPVIETNTDTLDFGAVFTGYSDTLILTIENTGTDVLEISNIYCDDPHFGAEFTALTINYRTSENMKVWYNANELQVDEGIIYIESNDVDNTPLLVQLQGRSVLPPEISVAPDSFDVALFTGNTTMEYLTIQNLGPNSLLEFNISITNSKEPTGFEVSKIGGYIDPSIYNNRYGVEVQGKRVFATDQGLGKAADDAKLFAVDMYAGNVVELDPETGVILNTIYTPVTFPWGPEGLAFDGRYLYYTGGDGIILRIDYESQTVVDQISTGLAIDALACSTDRLYVLEYNNAIYEVDYEEGLILDTLYVPYSVGGGLSFGGSRGTLFCGTWGYGILEIDLETEEVINVLPDSSVYYGLAYSNSLDLLFVADVNVMQVMALDPNDGTMQYSFDGLASALAADESGTSTSWLEILVESGSIEGGDSVTIPVKFDATGMFGGDYRKYIHISHNDPANEDIFVPADLHVTGAPVISVNTQELDFGDVFTGYSDTLELVIENTGTDVLEISNIYCNDSHFDVSPNSLTIDYSESTKVNVWYNAVELQEDNGVLYIESNDEDNTPLLINLTANSIALPVIVVTPDSLYVQMMIGTITTRDFSISNEGGSPLYVNIDRGNQNDSVKLTSGEPNDRDPASSAYCYGSTPVRDRKIGPAGSTTEKKADAVSVLIIYESNSDLSELEAFLGAYSDITLSTHNANSFLPSLGKLNANDLVLVCNNGAWNDAEGLGNVLADYVDAGGSVIVTVPTFYGSEYSLAGRFIDENYMPVLMADSIGNDVLGDYDETHPVMQNINSIYADLILMDAESVEEAEEVANFSAGATMVAIKDRVIALNVFVAYPGYWDGDIPQLFYNAIKYLTGTSWLTVLTDEVTVAQGASETVTVQIDATGLALGEYWGYLNIESNDPVTPLILFPVHLNVVDYSGVDELPDNESLQLMNYPNPFTEFTTIAYNLESGGFVTIEIYTMQGELIETLVHEYQSAGLRSVEFGDKKLPSGMYMYKLIADGIAMGRSSMIKE